VAKLGKVTPSMQIPLYLTYLWVPLGFVITGIQYILTVVKNLRSDDVYISYEQIDSYDEGEGIESPSELAAETAADRAN
jgi:TRAP-type C4-dicarboxylate transport system permease small subunit